MILADFYTFLPPIDCYEHVSLTFGKYCSIGSGLKIYSGTHACIEHPEVVSTYAFNEVKHWDYPASIGDGKVKVGNDVWIATDVRILTGVTIGDGAIIGAGSLVTKDVPPYAFAAGNPAVVKSYRFEPKEIEILLQIKWWDWSEEKLMKAMPLMRDIKLFCQKYE